MKNRWSLKDKNQGASLLAVLVALIFVGIIAVIIMNVTMTNIQMRGVEQSGKENFYTAETIMDELTAGLNNVAARSMEEAYTQILSDYRNIMVTGADVQQEFTKLYMEELQETFWDGDDSTRHDTKITHAPNNVEEIIYVIGYYKEEPLKENIATAVNKSCLKFTEEAATFTADYEEGLFTLENVEIIYKDASGYETSIKTDMVFHTPVLNFDGSNIIKEYMKYSLIADNMVEVSAANIAVDGNVYAGVNGIKSIAPGSALFTGSNIVTRGDIEVGMGTSITIGNGTSRIWAENVETTGNGMASALVLNGNCYIADDLTLNGKNSTVELYGNYYGYNFQDKYDEVRNVSNSAYSSAMMINAKNCRLDMTGLNYLLLSGRTYISRGSKENIQNQDIMLGESIAARTNQLAYYVPETYLDVTDAGNIHFTAEGIVAYADAIGVENIGSYLNSAHPVLTYYFKDNGIAATRYYLNFAGEQQANDFFAAYYNANSDKVNSFAESYIGDNAIILDSSTLYTLKGDILYQTADGEPLQEKKITISGTDWQPGAGEAADGIYWEYADRLAINYKSLQLYLEDSHVGVTTDNVRFEDGMGNIDKSLTPLMENLLDVNKIKTDYPSAAGIPSKNEKVIQVLSAISKRVAVVVNNEGMEQYRIPPDFTEGIIIATGDVLVQGNFNGMIISGGTVSFAANASVTADELLVSQLFKEDIALTTPLFAAYFKDYNTLSDSVIGIVQIDEYLTYENWTKNGE